MDRIKDQRVTDHMANERTYLAWVRTGIAVIALGFVVAKFGIIIRELGSGVPTSSFGLSSLIGVLLVIAGSVMQVMALRSFIRNRASIESGTYNPSYFSEVWLGIMVLVMAVLLIYYMLLTL
ncbi:MAG: YidH family protein [Thermoplasmata archaeon]